VNGAFVLYVSGVESGSRLEQNDPAFFRGHGPMLDAARNDDELAFFYPLVRMIMMVAELHAEAAFDDEEHFIFVVMMVEDEFAIELYELDLLTVEFGGDSRLVVVGEFRKFFGDVNFWHAILAGAQSLIFKWMSRDGRWSRKFKFMAVCRASLGGQTGGTLRQASGQALPLRELGGLDFAGTNAKSAASFR
jgi:hypothetical protein